MTVRNDILKQLKDDLKNNLTRLNGYNSDLATVMRGNVIFSDVQMHPGISFYLDSDDIFERELDPTIARVLNIVIILYVDNLTDEFENLHNFITDVENFLYSSDWTYYNSTLVGDILIDEYSEIPDTSYALINCQVFYHKE